MKMGRTYKTPSLIGSVGYRAHIWVSEVGQADWELDDAVWFIRAVILAREDNLSADNLASLVEKLGWLIDFLRCSISSCTGGWRSG